MKNFISRITNFSRRYDEYFRNRIVGPEEPGGVTILLKLYYLFDIILALIVHGSGTNDYFHYEFHKKRYRERKTFVTARKAKRIYSKTQDKHRKVLRDKLMTIQVYGKYFNRDWLYIPGSDLGKFREFCGNHSKFIAKPRFGSCARNVSLIDTLKHDNLDTLYSSLGNGDYLLEELIVQHPKMSSLHPPSVNSLRITTVMTEHGAKIMVATLRMGNRNSFVDNRSAGGIIASVDLKTRVVYTTGVDKWLNRYIHHPVTGTQIVGFQIPMWDDIIRTTREIAETVPEVMYAGWDIALSDEGAILIEGNSRGMMYNQQLADQIGKWPQYKEWVNGVSRLH